MKNAFLIFILILSMLLSSCGSTLPQSGKDTDTDPGDFDENTEEITPSETEKVPQNEKITVVCDEEYTKEIDEEYLNTDVPVTHHKIRIPKLTLESENASNFNMSIYGTHGREPIHLLEKEYYLYDMVYNIDYVFEEYNGIFGIMIKDYSSPITKYRSEKYYGYYYDTVNDRELDYFEYLEALGVDYDELIQAAVDSVRSYNSDEWFELNGDFSAYEISAAIFSEKKAYISVPLSESDKILIEYEQRFVEKTDKKYEVSIEDRLEIYYNTYKDLINSSPKRDIKDAFIVDYNGDGVPELVLDYDASVHSDFICIFGIGDNDFSYSYSGEYGTGLISQYAVMLYEGQVGLMEFVYDCPAYTYVDGEYDLYTDIYFHDDNDRNLYCNIAYENSRDYYGYKYSEDAGFIKISKREYQDFIKEYNNVFDKYKVSGITHGFRGPWELQKSMLSK